MSELKEVTIENWTLESGNTFTDLPVFYQTFGPSLGTAPVVLVNHALTGNSNVVGENGWWNDLIGESKTINTNHFTVLAINIPGNGFDGNEQNLISDYKKYIIRDIAQLFWQVIFHLEIDSLFAVIGGSLGGAIAWEMAVIEPVKIKNLIPIATDWKATDWMIANVLLQDKILNNSNNPIVDARIHAMLLYRTPQSLKYRFQRELNHNKSSFEIEAWLVHHGNKLHNRFKLSSYKLMNHLLKTNDITRNRNEFLAIAKTIQSNIHLVVVDSDLFFVASENQETYNQMKEIKDNVYYHEIQSKHGHDAFLIEYDQLNAILTAIFDNN
jgi:homoserine O-acetyltransferase/O-succinyltransferase